MNCFYIYSTFFYFLGNCPPTPSLSHHFALSEEVSVNVSLEGGGGLGGWGGAGRRAVSD